MGALALGVLLLQATVAGAVRDATSGQPVVHAVLSLTDLNRVSRAGPDGRYELRLVPAGPQHLAVRALGYRPRTLHALVPRAGTLQIDVVLEPDPQHLPPIVVNPEERLPVRGLERDQGLVRADRSLGAAAIRNHPLLAEPDAFRALSGGDVVMSPETPSGIHVRGGAADHTGYVLDGIPILNPYHSAGIFGAWNPDALERIELWSTLPSLGHGAALAGVVEGITRAPGRRLGASGAFSTTHASLTADGPLGRSAGWLASVRSGYPDIVAPGDESSYVTGSSGDWLFKLEAPVLRGDARLLAYGNDNELGAAAELNPAEPEDARRNRFDWKSRSFGAEWHRSAAPFSFRVAAWRAVADAGASWFPEGDAVELDAARRDVGLVAVVEHAGSAAATNAGIRTEWSTTEYRLERSTGSPETLGARTPVVTVFAEQLRRLGPAVDLLVGGSLAKAAGDLYASPRAQLRWRPAAPLTLSAGYARSRQYAQSLRNPESVAGNLFPPDLFVGAGAPEVPVARSDLGVAAIEYRPWAGGRVALEAYGRDFEGMLLPALAGGDPFARGELLSGSGTAKGLSLEAGLATSRVGVLLSYGLQRVRITHADSSYVPGHGASHLLEGGVVLFPAATLSIRVGAAAILGRRSTALAGGFEWESCNLLDRGCEFVGSPVTSGAPGGTELPAYFRLDLGVRQHWHLHVGGRDATLGLFGTLTNAFGRRNLLALARDPATGELVPVEMRPRAPLVVGLDWRF